MKAQDIASLKICLLESLFKISVKNKQALPNVCLFIVTAYFKPWLKSGFAVKASTRNLCLLK